MMADGAQKVIVPGYGMAVSVSDQVKEFADILQEKFQTEVNTLFIL